MAASTVSWMTASSSRTWESFLQRGLEAVAFSVVSVYVIDAVKHTPDMGKVMTNLDVIRASQLNMEGRISNIEATFSSLNVRSPYPTLPPRLMRTIGTTSWVALEPYSAMFKGQNMQTRSAVDGWRPNSWGPVLQWFAKVRENAHGKTK